MYACMTPVGFDTSDKFENHCFTQSRRQSSRLGGGGGQAFIRGGPKFEIKHNSHCLQKSKLVN